MSAASVGQLGVRRRLLLALRERAQPRLDLLPRGGDALIECLLVLILGRFAATARRVYGRTAASGTATSPARTCARAAGLVRTQQRAEVEGLVVLLLLFLIVEGNRLIVVAATGGFGHLAPADLVEPLA